jgi:hypothetical protein
MLFVSNFEGVISLKSQAENKDMKYLGVGWFACIYLFSEQRKALGTLEVLNE